MLPTRFNQARRLRRRSLARRRDDDAALERFCAEATVEATYDYVDEEGRLIFQVVRFAGKEFRQRRPDGAGGWTWRLGDVRRVLYHLDELARGDTNAPVYVVEGEKDVDCLRQRGQIATCNPFGAQGWRAVADSACKALAGRNVIVVADRDASGVGQRLAREIEASLRGVVRSIRVVVAPPPFKDTSDLFDACPRKDTASILGELIDLDEYEASLQLPCLTEPNS